MDQASATWTWWAWEALGLVGYTFFFARHLAQWVASERARRPVMPVVYWYLSIAGALITIVYAVHKESAAFLIPQIVGLAIYGRNLLLEMGYRRHELWREDIGFDRPEFPWPLVSVIVPIHNEAKVLTPALRALTSQDYPHARLQLIAALNGCTDESKAMAEEFGLDVVESEQAGMSFGKNLGARHARGEILLFVDADTILDRDAVRRIVEMMHNKVKAVAAVPAVPERGGVVVRCAFMIGNRYARKRQLQTPSGVLAVHKDIFESINGFDETLPQGTSSDFFMRARDAGAEFVYVDRARASTSVRRFEHIRFGVIRQMLKWRRNHEDLEHGEKKKVQVRSYETVR